MNEERPSRTLVRDLMRVGVFSCGRETPTLDVIQVLLDRELEAAVVLDEQGNAVGHISRDALVSHFAHDDYRERTAEQVMIEGVPQVPPDIPLTAAAQIMQDLGVRVVFIMHHAGGIEYPAAALSYEHILRLMTARTESDLIDLGIKAARESPMETFLRRRDEARRKAGL